MFIIVCILLAVATAVITEVLPVDSKWKPLIPKAVGVVAVAVGIQFFGLDYEGALATFASALSSGTVAGLVKYTFGFRDKIKSETAKLPGKGGQKFPPPGDGDPSING